VYDATGQRVRKICERSDSLVEERTYLGDVEVYRRRRGDERLERTTVHVHDHAVRIASVETRMADTADADRAPPQLIRFQLRDHLGSSVLELDEQARVISREEYTPYGSTSYQSVRAEHETSTRYRYSGKERDEETGLYYYGARYYLPWLGRWMSCDPSGVSDGVDAYVFAHDRPTVEVDGAGTDGEPWWRFTEAGFQYQTGKHDLFRTDPGYDTGFAPLNLVVNLVVTASNVCTIPFNAVTEIAAIPEEIARAAGASETDIEAMNFALMMTGVGEVAALPRISQALTVATEVKNVTTTAVEVKNVATTVNEIKNVATTATEVKNVVTTATEVKNVATAATEVKNVAAVATEAKNVATTATEAKTVVTTATEAKEVADTAKAAEQTKGPVKTLFHYTDEAGQKAILDSERLNPSLKSVNPKDARFGNGQYLSDIVPGTKTTAQLSRAFVGQPFQGARFTHFVEIIINDLEVLQGRPGVFVIPNESPLDLVGRILGWGKN
jgi:RHS repeat-associated protein